MNPKYKADRELILLVTTDKQEADRTLREEGHDIQTYDLEVSHESLGLGLD